jgi:hypothetical protein
LISGAIALTPNGSTTAGPTMTGPQFARRAVFPRRPDFVRRAAALRPRMQGDVISDYEFRAEPKCADSKGNTCEKDTRGLLQRRHVAIDRIRFIGKESNELEEIDSGLIHSTADAYTEFIDPRRDDWNSKIRPTLKQISLSKLCVETGFSRRALINWRTGKARPHARNQAKLSDLVRKRMNTQ